MTDNQKKPNKVREDIEKELSLRIPQFKSKEEVIEHVNGRIADKRAEADRKYIEGTASPGYVTGGTVQHYQGNGRGNATNASTETGGRSGEAPNVYGGNGRDASGEREPYGYPYRGSDFDRESTSSGGGSYQRDRPVDGSSEQAIYAKPRQRKGGLKSKFAPFKEAFTLTGGKKKDSASPRPKPKQSYKTLSQAEAIQVRPKLIEYITWQSEHTDQFIIATTKGHDPTIVIWSDLEEAEIEILADYLIERGKKDATTAQAVRFASTVVDRLKVAVILAPRLYKTVNIYLARGLDIPIWIR